MQAALDKKSNITCAVSKRSNARHIKIRAGKVIRYLVRFMILTSQRSLPGPSETTNEHVDDGGEGERKGKRVVVLILRPGYA